MFDFLLTLKELLKKINKIDSRRNLLVSVQLNVVYLFMAPLLLNPEPCFLQVKDLKNIKV